MKKKNLMEFMKRVIAGFVKEGRLGTAHVYGYSTCVPEYL